MKLFVVDCFIGKYDHYIPSTFIRTGLYHRTNIKIWNIVDMRYNIQ